jgi:hypothetical protein
MKKKWETGGRTLDRRAEDHLKSLKIPLRRRMDVMLFAGILVVFILLALVWGIGIIVGDRLGIFNPPPIRSIEDNRILTNIREEIDKKPLLDAVKHLDDGCLYIAQQGGTVHSYNPSTRLWNSEQPFLETDLLTPDIVMLRSGSGADPLSNHARECPDPESLWGVSANAGLVRRINGRWQRVIGDSSFIGSQNKPVRKGQLTAAAVSSDRNWLVVGTKEEGIGVYHLESRQWVPLQSRVFKEFPSLSVTHIAWWQNRFWVGGPSGLISMEIEEQTQIPRIFSKPFFKGRILDLDVDLKNRLWVLEERNCQGEGGNCLRLTRFLDLQHPWERMVDERNIYPYLNTGDLYFAQYWGDRLLVAGKDGVFSYDPKFHSWECHFKGSVLSTLTLPDGKGFYFGYTGGMGVAAIDDYEPWRNPDKKSKCWQVSDAAARIKKIRIGRQNEVVGLAESGKVFAIDKNKDKARKIFEGGRTMFDPSNFRAVFGFGNTNTVLFIGDEGALVHDIAARTYKDIPSALLPEWLRRSDWQRLQFVTSGDNTYAASPLGARTAIYQIPTSAVTAADFRAAVRIDTKTISGTIGRLRNWGDHGVVVIAGGEGKNGRVLRFQSQEEPLIGAPLDDLDPEALLDVISFDNGLMAATSHGLRKYDYHSRKWVNVGVPPGTFPIEVANFNGQLLIVTANGKLMKFVDRNNFTTLVGGERGFDIQNIELSDVMEKNGKLYLAGSGKIYLYDPDKRQIIRSWELPVKGEVTLKGFIGEEPLALCANTATFGNRAIDVDAGPVINLFVDAHSIWMVRIEDGQKYLKHYPIDVRSASTVKCFFRRSGAGKGVTQILDAVSLPSKNDLIAAATNMGVRFYSAEARSWYQNDPQIRIPKVDRIHKLNNHLVFMGKEGDNFGITFATLDSIQLSTSTSTDPGTVTFKPRPQHVWVKAFTINRQEQQLAFIDEHGAILEWKKGRKKEILPPPGESPAPTQLRRVYDRSKTQKVNGNHRYLLFTTDSSILRYDLEKRFWQEIPMDGLPSEAIDINIEREGNPKIVVVKTKSGAFYWGAFESPDDPTKNNRLRMEPIFTPSTWFESSGDRLKDVQQRGGNRWTFVLDDRIKYYDPHKRQWEEDVFFPGNTGSTGSDDFAGIRAFYQVGKRNRTLGVIVENDGRTWWVARHGGNRPRTFARYRLQSAHTTALDTRGTIWRFTADGQLFKHQRPPRGNYPEIGTLYKAPFLIDPGNVRQAFEWKKCILFETEKGIRALDTSSRREIHLTGMAFRFTGTREVFTYGDQLLLRNADTILVLLQKNDQFIETLRLPYKGEWPSDISMAANKRKIKDQWPRLKKKVRRLPNGRTAYDPILGLFIGKNGELFARRPEGNEHLVNDAVVNIDTLPKPLDVGWLKWNRAQKSFEVKTPTGKRTISRSDFVQNQRLIFEEVDAILALGEKKIYVANAYGIWTHSRKDLSLTDDNITFQPLDWSEPTSAAHGRFITSSGIYSKTGQLRLSQNKYQFSIGDVTFSEDIPRRRVEAWIKTGGKDINAFASSGFTWDQGKRGIFYGENNQLLVQSDAGFHPVKGYTGFSRQLNQKLLSSEQPNPTLVNNNLWKWEKQNGEVTIRLDGKSYNFKPIIGQSGFGFTSDRLLDAVTYQNRLYVMTEAFLEVADSSAQLSSFTARRFPFQPTSHLKNIKDASGRDDLILFSPEGNFHWDNQSQQFVRVTPDASHDPNRERLLARIPVNQPRLRFRSRWEGPIKKEVNVKNISGKESWVPFQFTRNRFPFDVVTSIAAAADKDKTRSYLYVGTNAGLQVYSGSLDTNAGLGQMDELYELRGSAAGSLEAVTKVGEPLDKPGLVIARSSALSIESHGGTSFRQCTNPALLDKRLRLETDFWRFVDQKGRLDGWYKDENGNFSSERITLQQGYFPHDFLKDIVVFENRVFAMWNNGWLTIHPTLSMELEKGIINQDKQDARPQRFIVIPQDISSDMPGQSGVPVSRGLYVEGQGWQWQSRLFQYDKGNWVEITRPDVRTRILEYADNPPIVLRKHLVLSSGEFTFKRRSLGGEWLPLPWEDGRVAVDKWSDFFFLDNQLWAASPLGLTFFSRTPDGQIVLDPDHFIVIQEPADTNNPLEITDIEVDQTSRVVTLRCEADSHQVYQGTLTDPVQSDKGIFKPLDSDPFVEKELVSKKESIVWEWHLKGNKDRSPGWLEGRFRGEAIQLIGGRFEFDTINSLAFFQENQVEIGTDAGGWYQAAEGDLNAENLKRPDVRLVRGGVEDGAGSVGGIDFFTIKEVLLTREGDEQVLGLRTAAGDYLRMDRRGALRRTRGCPEFLGDDGFWRYEKTEGALVITAARSKEGKAIRTIQEGRFIDDIVQGLPVTAVYVEGIYYLIPTQAGVLGVDKNLRPREIHAKPFPGLQPDTVPEILFMLTPETPLYAATDGLRFLSGSRGVFPDLKLRVPEGAVLTAVENGPQDFVRARWKMKETGRRGWTLFTPGKSQAVWENTIYVNVNGFDQYIKNRKTWGYPEPWIQIRLKPHQMEVFQLRSPFSHILHFQNPIALLTPIVKDKTLFLIGKKNLLEINLEHAMTKSFEAAADKHGRTRTKD